MMGFPQLNSYWSSMVCTISILSAVTLLASHVNSASLVTQFEQYKDVQNPEFVAPVKNITSPLGTNADFACIIRNLGSSRIMWFRRQQDKKEELLGVNGLKISKSPKISLSLIPSSGIVTESILYIYNIGHDDVGEYICGVNTDPVITQSGNLEIKIVQPEKETKKYFPKSKVAIISQDEQREQPAISIKPNKKHETDDEFGITAIIIDNNSASDSPSNTSGTNNNGIFCIDFPQIWKDSKTEARKLFNSIWDKVHRYF